MSHLRIQRGLPASGKSTIAARWVEEAPGQRARTNRDDLRESIFRRSGVLPYADEMTITDIQRRTVSSLLERGIDVVVDDTNLRAKFARAWVDLAVEHNATWEVVDFHVDLHELIRRDEHRALTGARHVGEQVLRDLWAKFPPTRWPEITPSEKPETEALLAPYAPPRPKWGMTAWVVDIDGTIAHNGGARGFFEWDKVGLDTPHADVIALVNRLAKDDIVILLSGRDRVCEEATEAWLEEHGVSYDYIYMRPEGDRRPDTEVKAELFDEFIRGQYNVLGVFDDRDQVVEMWRAAGLRVYQVAPGPF